MPRPKPDPEVVDHALQLIDAGCSNYETAETLGITEGTVRRWVKNRAALSQAPSSPPPAAAVLPAHMTPAAPAVPPIEILDIADPRELVRQLIREQRSAIQADRLAGNMRGAASNAATLERLVKSLKQMDAGAADDAGTFKISRAEVDRTEEQLRERIAAICNRPLLCAECSRALSVRWGVGALPPEPHAKGA